MSPIDEILAAYADLGSTAYGGEHVTQLEHALQTAMLAEESGAPATLVVASLLHDYGHLIHARSERIIARGVDDRHELLGAHRLSSFFSEAVTMPIRLHVDAKRYLCATDPEYRKILSPASTRSLELQGGALSLAEADAFIRLPFASEAAKLRRWDEAAKVVSLRTPRLEHFRPALEACQISSN